MPATVERALQALRLLEAAESGMTVSELTEQLQISRPSVSRLMQTLLEANFVARLGRGEYTLGMRIWELSGAVANLVPARKRILVMLAPSIRELGRPINLHLQVGEVLYAMEHLELVDGVLITTPFGSEVPLHATSSGKAYLAFARPKILAAVKKHDLQKYTETTLASLQALEDELALVRQRGYALNHAENRPEGNAIGAPLLDSSGFAIGSINVSASLSELDEQDTLANQVADLAAYVSQQLGYRHGKSRAVF